MNKRSHIFMLFLATIFWGTTFVAQRIGAEHVGAYTYLAGRSWIAVVFLTPVVHAFDRFHDRRGTDNRRPRSANARKQLILASITAGVALCAASAAQQIGVAYTTASKAGFITALYVVLVPILGIFIGKRPSAHIWACVALALVGMYLLCITGGDLKLQIGDAYELACALLFAVEILLVYHFSPLVDGVRLSRMMFLVVAVLSTVLMFVLESPTWESVRAALPAIAYAGIISSGIGYTLQILGQEGVNPTVASLVMSFESVFSALSGWLILGERLSPRELLGSALMFAAIVLSQVEIKPKRA
jgi:drug/metabolite transporter (DMT)-like permease